MTSDLPVPEPVPTARELSARYGPIDEVWLCDTIREAVSGTMGIYLFGSRAQDTARPDSDLDLAILVAGYADPQTLWVLSSRLANQVGCEVDLLDFRAASTVMQYQVLTTGRRLWGKDPEAGLFECFVMSEKLNLDEARAGLLADIARDGRIYGR